MAIQTEQDFINFVQQAEQLAQSNPKAYTTKLTLFALLGYLVIFLVLFTLIGLAGGLAASAVFSTGLFLLLVKKKLVFAILFAIWVLFRALWVKFTPPKGFTLTRSEFPELFTELDALSAKLDSLKIHEVILDRNLNAAVLQHPRLGVFGWHKNYLILGYPLLLTLSAEEMRSVLAHEFGHLSGNHGRFGGWIYRLRQTWLRVMSAFQHSESWGGQLMKKFFNWYSPQFEAYSFAYARSNEYAADAISAELTSPEIATRALVNVYVTAPYIDQSYWDNYFNYAEDHKQPPYAPFQGLSTFLKDSPLAKDEVLKRIKQEMSVNTHYADTHPSLKDRVAALAAHPQLPSSPTINAANSWLGEHNQKIMGMFDKEWLEENGQSWEQRYEYVASSKRSLAEMSTKQTSELNDEELWSYANLTNEFKTKQEALPLFQAYQERHPEDPDAALFMGLALLAQNDDAGLDQLRTARDRSSLLEQTANAGYDYLNEQGKEKQADEWWHESITLNELYDQAQAERDCISIDDELEAPQMAEDLLEKLLANLGEEKKIAKVWLAQKVLEQYPENPIYVVAFSTKGFHFSNEAIQDRIAKNLDIEADIFLVCKSGDHKAIAKKVIKAGKQIV